MAKPVNPGFIGAGIGYRHVHRQALLDDASAVRPGVLEIMPDHFFGDGDRVEETLGTIAERYPIVLHDVGLSLATVGDTSFAKARLRRIAAVAAVARPLFFGEHLSLTRSPSGVDLGHLAPIWLTHEMLDLVCDRVRALQDVLGVPVVLENIAAPFVIPGGDLTEPEFFTQLVERTGCGMLLDLTNLLYTARNLDFDVHERLQAYPLEAVKQLHLAGGFSDGQGWIDSHSAPVEDATYALLGELARARESLRVIIVERDTRLGTLSELVAEAERAAEIWRTA